LNLYALPAKHKPYLLNPQATAKQQACCPYAPSTPHYTEQAERRSWCRRWMNSTLCERLHRAYVHWVQCQAFSPDGRFALRWVG
jgi:hypothetical protein